MKLNPLFQRSTLGISNRAIAHLRDYRLLGSEQLKMDEPTRLRLGQHLADAAEKFIADLRASAPRNAKPMDDAPPSPIIQKRFR